MKQFFISASGLDARGVGPRIMIRTAPFLFAAILAEILPFSYAGFSFLDNSVVKTSGLMWLSIGSFLFLASLVQFSRNFPKGKLLQTGLFACSRNPIYSTWIIFILPALALILNNWLFLLSAAVMCVTTIILVKEEEIELLKVYGKQYAEYRTRVGCIIWFLGKKAYEA